MLLHYVKFFLDISFQRTTGATPELFAHGSLPSVQSPYPQQCYVSDLASVRVGEVEALLVELAAVSGCKGPK